VSIKQVRTELEFPKVMPQYLILHETVGQAITKGKHKHENISKNDEEESILSLLLVID